MTEPRVLPGARRKWRGRLPRRNADGRT
jgi:hypothetical protein